MDHGHDHQHGSSCDGHSHGHSEHSNHSERSEHNAHDHSDCNSDNSKRDGTDANDYSRFEHLTDSDDELEDTVSKEDPKVEFTQKDYDDAMLIVCMLKDNGNASFKAGGLVEAEKHYSDAIASIEKFKDFKVATEKQYADKKEMLISLHGNLAMVYLKQDRFKETLENCNSVLKYDKDNVKAYYRRGLAFSKLSPPNLDSSKEDLNTCLKLDPSNAPAKKELIDVMNALKAVKQKEKELYGNLFSKGSGLYEDKEKERLKKIRDEENEKARLQDDWRKSNIDRRSQRLEEQTFDVWKKVQDDAKELEKKEREAANKSAQASTAPAPVKSKPKETVKSSSDSLEYDDEDAKIIAETKAKGYCYFKKQPSSDDAALIGDIRPTTIKSSVSLDSALTSGGGSSGGVISGGLAASSWNHAGTWEERNTTDLVKNKLKNLFIDRHFRGDNFEVAVSNVKEPEGEANIIFSKGKKKHGFDMSLSMDIDLFMDVEQTSSSSDIAAVDDGTDEVSVKEPNDRKKYKATVNMSDLNTSNAFDWSVSYKNSKNMDGITREKLQNVVASFRSDVKAALHTFIEEYSSL